MFVGAHCMLAELSGIEELSMSMEEGGHLAAAAQNVARHYNVETTQKTLDWIALAGVAGQVYGLRIAAYLGRRRKESREPRQPAQRQSSPTPSNAPSGAGNVQPIRPAIAVDALDALGPIAE